MNVLKIVCYKTCPAISPCGVIQYFVLMNFKGARKKICCKFKIIFELLKF